MTKKYRSLENIIRDVYESKSDPCWDGYKQEGMKKKNGKNVPNCVPEETMTDIESAILEGGHSLEDIQDIKESEEKLDEAVPLAVIAAPVLGQAARMGARYVIRQIGRQAARRAPALGRPAPRPTTRPPARPQTPNPGSPPPRPPQRTPQPRPGQPPARPAQPTPGQPPARPAQPTPGQPTTGRAPALGRPGPAARPQQQPPRTGGGGGRTGGGRTGRGRGLGRRTTGRRTNRPRIGLGFPGLSTSSSPTSSEIRQGHVDSYRHYPTEPLRVNEPALRVEDATTERSKIENVARPSARRDRVVKQQEIQKKIIDENRSLAAAVKKNVEETRKRERNSSPIIINPKTNDPDPDGTPGGY